MNSKIKKGLGRGLSSLIGETKIENKTNKLNLSEIIPNKYQPRKNFDENNLEDLSNSIRERGVIQPIIVRKSSSQDSKFDLRTIIGCMTPRSLIEFVKSSKFSSSKFFLGWYLFGLISLNNNLFVLVSTFVSPIRDDNPLPKPFLIFEFIMLHSQVCLLE